MDERHVYHAVRCHLRFDAGGGGIESADPVRRLGRRSDGRGRELHGNPGRGRLGHDRRLMAAHTSARVTAIPPRIETEVPTRYRDLTDAEAREILDDVAKLRIITAAHR